MSGLRRMTPFGWSELKRHIHRHGTLPETLPHSSWSEPRPGGVDLGLLRELVQSWQEVGPSLDAEHAIRLHETLRIGRRMAADRLFWVWLAAWAARLHAAAVGRGERSQSHACREGYE